jgi:hypothetical protein
MKQVTQTVLKKGKRPVVVLSMEFDPEAAKKSKAKPPFDKPCGPNHCEVMFTEIVNGKRVVHIQRVRKSNLEELKL